MAAQGPANRPSRGDGETAPHGGHGLGCPQDKKALGKPKRLQALWPEPRAAGCVGGNKEERKALSHLAWHMLPDLLEAWWAQRRPAETQEASLGTHMEVASSL